MYIFISIILVRKILQKMKIKGTPNRKLEKFSTYSKVLYVEYSRKKSRATRPNERPWV